MEREILEGKIVKIIGGLLVFVVDMVLVGWCVGILLGVTLSFIQTFAVMVLAKVLSGKPLLD